MLALPAVAVISKLPRLGRSKTRLGRTLGPETALALHRAFLQDQLAELDRPDRWQLHLVHDAPTDAADREQLADLLGERVHPLVPGQASLGRELLVAFGDLLQRHPRAIIISGDVPQVRADAISAALQALDAADVVLGPGPDGGYWLVGMKAAHDIFTTVPMGTAGVEKATVAVAQRLGLVVASAQSLVDMDEAQDLLALEHAPPELAPATRAAVASLQRHEFAAILPTELQVEVTSRCNLRCSACLISYQQLGPPADLDMTKWQRIVGALPKLERVAFQLNGEPLLCKDVFAMIADAVGRGAWTVMNTNATLLDRTKAQQVLDSGLHELRVSLDGAQRQTVAQMACADILDEVQAGVRAMVAVRGTARWPRISLWMVATRKNIAELPDLVELAAQWRVDEVYTQRLVLTGHGVAQTEHSIHGRTTAELREIVARAEAVAARTGVALRASGRVPILQSFAASDDPFPQRGCWRPWRSAVVTASLQVLPCCIASFTRSYDQLTLGDLGSQSWDEIWNADPYRRLRRGLLTAQPNPECRDCGIAWSL